MNEPHAILVVQQVGQPTEFYVLPYVTKEEQNKAKIFFEDCCHYGREVRLFAGRVVANWGPDLDERNREEEQQRFVGDAGTAAGFTADNSGSTEGPPTRRLF